MPFATPLSLHRQQLAALTLADPLLVMSPLDPPPERDRLRPGSLRSRKRNPRAGAIDLVPPARLVSHEKTHVCGRAPKGVTRWN